MSSVATNKSSDNLAAQSQSDFSASLTQIDNEATVNFAYQNGGSGALPDEPGYQPGQIFVKVRRKISMPKVYVPVSYRVVTSSVQRKKDKKIDEDLINFEQSLSSLAAESVESRAKRCATMPMNLDDLDFLNAILDQTISNDFSNTLASTESTANETISTSSTTTTVTSTATTTTTMINPTPVTNQNSLNSGSEFAPDGE
jgi:hypothetical protein